MLVGIPDGDEFGLKHSTARIKGLTILLSRRMKHTYPRAISLVSKGIINPALVVSHRFHLPMAPEAFENNAKYADGVLKTVIQV